MLWWQSSSESSEESSSDDGTYVSGLGSDRSVPSCCDWLSKRESCSDQTLLRL